MDKNNKMLFSLFSKQILIFFIFLILVSGCTQGISQQKVDELNNKVQMLEDKLNNVIVSGTCSGYIVATVRGFSQDYVSDEEDKMAIISEFQSNPFMIELTPAQIELIELGSSYVFRIRTKDASMLSDEYSTQSQSVELLLAQYRLVIESIASATEDQKGFDGSTLACKQK